MILSTNGLTWVHRQHFHGAAFLSSPAFLLVQEIIKVRNCYFKQDTYGRFKRGLTSTEISELGRVV